MKRIALGSRRLPFGRGVRGFTLLEVMLAVALGAIIMTAATTFVFGMGELWGAGANERLFKKHTRGVSRYLEQSFEAAADRYSDEDETPVYWMDWEGDNSQTDQFLTFELEKSPGAFVWPSEPLPQVVCSLDVDPDEGLYVLWRSKLEARFDEDPPRRTLLSPFVKAIRYHYIDYTVENPEWEITDEPKEEAGRERVLPQRIELLFQFKGEMISRQLALPDVLSGTPVF